MLADQGQQQEPTGALGTAVHLPGEWLSALVAFIAGVLPGWRDDPVREAVSAETPLTAQLCSRLNSVARHTSGWDFLQFRREEPDEADSRRSIDLVAAASGAVIWIAGREYTEYRTLFPIECKRLPTPGGSDRDEREYLISRFKTTGGVQRFKSGHHGRAHARAAMIGYVQDKDISYWRERLDGWIDSLVADTAPGWSTHDKLALAGHDAAKRTATLRSRHARVSGLAPIQLDHLWIEL